MTPDDNPFEAGLGFAVAMEKPGGFIGHESLSRLNKHQLTRRLVGFALEDPEPLLYHDEPIWCEGELVGQIRVPGCMATPWAARSVLAQWKSKVG